MTTKNFKAFLQTLFLANENRGSVAATDTQGNTIYLAPYFSNNQTFPYNAPTFPATSDASYSVMGTYVGTGNTAASENDYCLESVISSGLNAVDTFVNNEDIDGNPYKAITITYTNTTASNITISEVGTVIKIYASTTSGGAGSQTTMLIDRTILENPLTVPANGTAILYYELKSIIS